MKYLFAVLLIAIKLSARSQSLQFYYDVRHTLDPSNNPKNFPSIYFEYYQTPDTGNLFIKRGPFLFKAQADLSGDQTNLGKYYTQISQEVRFWQRPSDLYLNLQYSGGLGVTTPKQYSYFISNTYLAGASYHYKIGQAFLTSVLNFRYVSYVLPSKDLLYTMYFYRGLFNYRAEVSGDFSLWTENNNHGDEATIELTGKRFYFFAEPQIWLNVSKHLSIGSKINVYYHVNVAANSVQIYPTAALRVKL
ncbi:DUF5020 family protein [Mucilaginibacter ginkgonis]|uniref:DUF5020 family protein n=1 Tax=Mucilaginibacter ginkgonis TaxID=2682091 RepID=A0A6I4I0H2_9SPHI|nr:DUF5020 family protein [Mucilaginibacter ginkgonis]QQL51060.1 DUF5020 family protein [Mucilaginibacter ginkgonis]